MKTKNTWIGLILCAVLLLAACSPQSEATGVMSEEEGMSESSEAMMMDEGEGEMMEGEEEEMMEEDEQMGMSGEEEMMDDADEEMMEGDMSTVSFVVRIENVSSEGGLTILAPGAYELNDHPVSFFTPGEPDRGQGLEALAEDGFPSGLVETIDEMMMGDEMMGFAVEIFNTPAGADEPGVAGPGAAYEFTVEAHPGQYLTFATMFVQSNDWFFAPGDDGIALFDAEGAPISGEITEQIFLWNAGTEIDQTPGEGPDQAPRQDAPNTGEDENGVVSLVESFTDYQISVTITPQQ